MGTYTYSPLCLESSLLIVIICIVYGSELNLQGLSDIGEIEAQTHRRLTPPRGASPPICMRIVLLIILIYLVEICNDLLVL